VVKLKIIKVIIVTTLIKIGEIYGDIIVITIIILKIIVINDNIRRKVMKILKER
jgi:hypothetical protein